MKLTLEMCQKLLDVFTAHDRTSCSDQNNRNQFANSAGWVSCTRCWLISVFQEGYVPENAEFELYGSIKLAHKKTEDLIGEYADLINKYGIEHPTTTNFLENNKGNTEFVELAKIAINLKKKLQE